MRPALLVPALLLSAALGGCNREPDFDERFDEASSTISASAEAIDAEIGATDTAVPSNAP